MTRKEFAQAVLLAVEMLPNAVREAMDNVVFVLDEKARRRKAHEVGIRRDEVLLGLYEGIPKTKRGAGYFGVLPDTVTLFIQPLEALAAGDPDALRLLIQDVIRHEVGHHLGFDERAIRALEQKRKKRYDIMKTSCTISFRSEIPEF